MVGSLWGRRLDALSLWFSWLLSHHNSQSIVVEILNMYCHNGTTYINAPIVEYLIRIWMLNLLSKNHFTHTYIETIYTASWPFTPISVCSVTQILNSIWHNIYHLRVTYSTQRCSSHCTFSWGRLTRCASILECCYHLFNNWFYNNAFTKISVPNKCSFESHQYSRLLSSTENLI